jgi:hypothetical protein
MTNATKNLDASRTEVINKLIDYNSTQNDLIFKTRKRLFKLEHNFRLLILAIAITGSVTALMGLVVVNG